MRGEKSGFSESILSDCLADLNETQQSIQDLSAWLIANRKHSKVIVSAWSRELLKARKERRLAFFYLANDVIQNSRKKSQDFLNDFMTVLPACLKLAAREANEAVRARLKRVLTVWQDRKIVDSSKLRLLWQAFELGVSNQSEGTKRAEREDDTPKKKQKTSASLKDEIIKELQAEKESAGPRTLSSALELITMIKSMQNSPSSDAHVREKIAALPPEVSDANLLRNLRDEEEAAELSKTVDEAVELLQEYNSRLANELVERKKLAKIMYAFLEDQKRQLNAEQEKLEHLETRLSHCDRLSSELDQHLQSLPDLSDVNLCPLPTAKELFPSTK